MIFKNDSYFSGHRLFCLKHFLPLILIFGTWGGTEVLILNHVILAFVLCV